MLVSRHKHRVAVSPAHPQATKEQNLPENHATMHRLSSEAKVKITVVQKARARLSKLFANALTGEPFTIARAEKSWAEAEPIGKTATSRTGFLQGQLEVPEDFDRMGEDHIRELFDGKE